MHPSPADCIKDAPMAMPTRKISHIDAPIMKPARKVSVIDAPIVVPKRKTSITRIFPSSFNKVLSSALDSSRRSQDTSMEGLDGYDNDSTMRSSCSFHLPSNSLSFHFSTTVVIEVDSDDNDTKEEEEEKRISFAATPTTDTKIGLCLDDYTMEELEACWYTHDDIRYMREKKRRKNKRKIFKPKSKKLQRKVLKREDTRWTA